MEKNLVYTVVKNKRLLAQKKNVYIAGKILKDDEHYSAEYKIKINNEELREDIIEVFTTFDWKEYLNCIAMRKIQQFHIIDVLKQNVKGIK